MLSVIDTIPPVSRGVNARGANALVMARLFTPLAFALLLALTTVYSSNIEIDGQKIVDQVGNHSWGRSPVQLIAISWFLQDC